jgi:hypothetical protein
MAVIKKGQASNFEWSIPSGIVSVSGRIVSIRKNDSIDKETLQNEEGETDGVVYLDPNSSGTVEVIMPSGGAAQLSLASEITVDGATCYVESVEKSWERRGWAKMSISFHGWHAISG